METWDCRGRQGSQKWGLVHEGGTLGSTTLGAARIPGGEERGPGKASQRQWWLSCALKKDFSRAKRVAGIPQKADEGGVGAWVLEVWWACHDLKVLNDLMGLEDRLCMRVNPGETGKVYRLLSKGGLSSNLKGDWNRISLRKTVPGNIDNRLFSFLRQNDVSSVKLV